MEMNNFDRNTRTLIVSFLIAIFALIPLRFIEVGEQQSRLIDAQVLGESITVTKDVNEEAKPENLLEAPYNTLEKCVSPDTVMKLEVEMFNLLKNNGLDDNQISRVLEEVQRVETNVCKN